MHDLGGEDVGDVGGWQGDGLVGPSSANPDLRRIGEEGPEIVEETAARPATSGSG